MNKIKILYLMYIDWGWIKQRPHFLAEKLSYIYDVYILCGKRFSKEKGLVKNESKNLKIKNSFRLPFIRWNFVYCISNYIRYNIIYRQDIKKSNIVWFTHPSLYSMFNKQEGQFIIYDCMDDMLEFNERKNVIERNRKSEYKICNEADILICSSEYLKKKLIKRYNLDRNIYIVNNAISLNYKSQKEISKNTKKIFTGNRKKFVYIGTISNWFNFDILLKSLDREKEIEYILFGPTEITIPTHEQIKYGGSIEHDQILSVMSYADALIMPFHVTELIKSVNPVKLYEYIYAYKPIISSRYLETEKFNPYVYLYSSDEEYFKFIENVSNNEFKFKCTEYEHKEFAKKNTWDSRIEEIEKLLTNLFK